MAKTTAKKRASGPSQTRAEREAKGLRQKAFWFSRTECAALAELAEKLDMNERDVLARALLEFYART